MKKVNLLSRAEMKKVLGGNDETVGEIGGSGDFCRFKYKYTENGTWSNWSDSIYVSSGGNAACVGFITSNQVVHCAYDCASN